jgi:5-methylcytosine-specific restriction enzyme A
MPDRIRYFNPAASLGPTAAESERKRFYNSAAWKRLRALVLRAHPLCRECLERGLVVEATIAHHVQDRLRRPDLALDRSNLVGVCAPCHSRHHAALRATPGGGQIPRDGTSKTEP